MIYRAYPSEIQRFISLPETGMGYQVIEAKVYGRSNRERYVVYNCELILELDTYFDEYKRQITSKELPDTLNESRYLPIDTDSISLVPKNIILELRHINESKKHSKHRYSGGSSAKDNPKESANGNEIFVRLSAYENDRRIDFERKRLRDGSCTTILTDYLDCIGYQDDPIDRYALPNDEPIKWAFYILPNSGDILQRGIVQPAFEHDGGGIEAYFENGTSNNTCYDKRSYGK